MRYVEHKALPSWASDTKTVQTLGKVLEEKPHRLSQVVKVRPDLTMNILTDGLMQVYAKSGGTGKKFEPINTMQFTWDVENNFIPRIKFVASSNDTGEGGSLVRLIMQHKYYDPHDTFRLDNGQILYVDKVPRRLSEFEWEYYCSLQGASANRRIDTAYTQKGKESMWMSNIHPEMSERGYSKFSLNSERHINYMSRHRVGDSFSGDAAARKQVFVQMAGKNGPEYAKMLNFEKKLMEEFLYVRNNNLLFSVSNFNEFGKCTKQDEQGRDLPAGDGVIPQAMRYGMKLGYSFFSTRVCKDMVVGAAERNGRAMGNTLTVVCNLRLYMQFHDAMEREHKALNIANNAALIRQDGKALKLGAHYNAYTIQGNDVIFMPDDTLTKMYPDQGFGICLNTVTPDGEANLQLVTLKGRQMISGTLEGMGGASGTKSGLISTSVDASEHHLLGYSGAALLNPYATMIVREQVAA